MSVATSPAAAAAAAPTTTTPAAGTDLTITRLIRSFIAVAIIGWGTSMLLTAIHLWVLPLPADAVLRGPMLVITSPWAYVGPVPLATIGAVYYLVMIGAGAVWLHTRSLLLERLLLPVTAGGVLASAGFVYLQLVPIGAICPFCMVSAVATTLLFAIELTVKLRGGVAASPPVRAERLWPVTFGATMAMTMLVLWALPMLPLPGR